jgi:hypothetical protein
VAPRDEVLTDAVLDLVAWFEVVDEATLPPALAVGALEQIAHHLHRLEGEDRGVVAAHARARAKEERDPRYRRAFEAVADDLGG